MEAISIGLAVLAAILVSVLVIVIALAIRDRILGGKQCDGKPYDTLDSEEWYARCGRVAPHREHMFKEYSRES